jgi:hypothetical protein
MFIPSFFCLAAALQIKINKKRGFAASALLFTALPTFSLCGAPLLLFATGTVKLWQVVIMAIIFSTLMLLYLALVLVKLSGVPTPPTP